MVSFRNIKAAGRFENFDWLTVIHSFYWPGVCVCMFTHAASRERTIRTAL